jgi:cold shock CspA family protein
LDIYVANDLTNVEVDFVVADVTTVPSVPPTEHTAESPHIDSPNSATPLHKAKGIGPGGHTVVVGAEGNVRRRPILPTGATPPLTSNDAMVCRGEDDNGSIGSRESAASPTASAQAPHEPTGHGDGNGMTETADDEPLEEVMHRFGQAGKEQGAIGVPVKTPNGNREGGGDACVPKVTKFDEQPLIPYASTSSVLKDKTNEQSPSDATRDDGGGQACYNTHLILNSNDDRAAGQMTAQDTDHNAATPPAKRTYGCITPNDGGRRLLAHTMGIEDGHWLAPGKRVSFCATVNPSNGLPSATCITGGYTSQLDKLAPKATCVARGSTVHNPENGLAKAVCASRGVTAPPAVSNWSSAWDTYAMSNRPSRNDPWFDIDPITDTTSGWPDKCPQAKRGHSLPSPWCPQDKLGRHKPYLTAM